MAAQADDRIVFVSDQGGGRELYVMDADGKNVQQLTSSGAESTEPAWSPDRRQIAFSSNRDGDTFEIYVMNADGNGVRRLTNNPSATYNGQPTWSPDGQQIAFVSNQSSKQDIFVVSTQGGTIQQLSRDNVGEANTPAWSPDGQSIAYASNISGHFDILLMNRDGSNTRALTHETQADSDSPAWAPNGRQIAFTTNHDGNSDLFLMNANGSNRTQLVSAEGSFFGSPAWSPDGQSIAFMVLQTNKDRSIRVVDVNGGSASVRQLTEGSYHTGWPSWASLKPIAALPSNTPTPTFANDNEPNPNPSVCVKTNPTHISVGMRVIVPRDGGGPTALRQVPHSPKKIKMMQEGEEATVIEGPFKCLENTIWWKLRTDDGKEGWSVEQYGGQIGIAPASP